MPEGGCFDSLNSAGHTFRMGAKRGNGMAGFFGGMKRQGLLSKKCSTSNKGKGEEAGIGRKQRSRRRNRRTYEGGIE